MGLVDPRDLTRAVAALACAPVRGCRASWQQARSRRGGVLGTGGGAGAVTRRAAAPTPRTRGRVRRNPRGPAAARSRAAHTREGNTGLRVPPTPTREPEREARWSAGAAGHGPDRAM